MESAVVLDLRDLDAGIPALTKALARVHAESAAVCLDDQGHTEPVRLHVSSIGGECSLRWPKVSEAMRRAHYDLQRATEFGACGIAFLLVRVVAGMTAIQASRKGTGFDYWLVPNDGKERLVFESCARLEVSGILKGSDAQFATRVKAKLGQSARSDETGLKAVAIVVEFSRPRAEVAER